MSNLRSARRSLTVLNTILFSAAFTVPAFAQIETVIVTAEKRAENLQTVPVAVTAFTAEKRDKIGITTIQDMANFTPGMTYSTSTDRVTMRSISRQTNVLSADSGVANYSDGIYQSFAVEAGRSTLDLSDVEVLRGPQGTLYGRNSIGGAINQITPRPSDTFGAEFRVDYENYDASTIEGSVTGPINDDWQYRFYGDWQRQGLGWTKNEIPGAPEEGQVINKWYAEGQIQGKEQNLDIWDRFYTTEWANRAGDAGAASGGWVPADYPTFEYGQGALYLNPGYGCTVAPGGAYATADTTLTSASSPLSGPAACSNPADKNPWHIARVTPYTTAVPFAFFNDLQLTYHTNEDFDIKFISGAENYRYVLTGPDQYAGNYPAPITSLTVGGSLPQAIPAGSVIPGAGACFVAIINPSGACPPLTVDPTSAFEYQQSEFFTQNEINFISTGNGPLQWQAGLYSFLQHESQPVSASVINEPQVGAPTLLFSPVPETNATCHLPDCVNNRWYDDRIQFNDQSLAAYGQVDYQLDPEWKVTGGLRYSYDRKYGTEQSRLVDFTPSAGIFPEYTGAFTEALDLTPSFIGVLDYHCGAPIDTGVTGCTTYNPATGLATRVYDHSSDAVTGMVDVDWTPDDQTLVYAKYSRGYKGGGFNTGIFTFIIPKPWVGPEHINAFEVGVKKTFEDWLVLDSALYYYDYTDVQVPLTVAAAPGGVNSLEFLSIPRTFSAGLDTEAIITPPFLPGLTGTISYSYDNAQITSATVPQFNTSTGTALLGVADPADPNAVVPGAHGLYTTGVGPGSCLANPGACGTDIYTLGNNTTTAACLAQFTATGHGCGWVVPQSLKGQRLPNTPRNKVALNLLYSWNIPDVGTFTPSVTYLWRDTQYGTIFSRFYNMAPSWSQFDSRVSFASPDGHWNFIAFIKNIGNTIGYDNGAIGTRYAGTIDRSCAGGPIVSGGQLAAFGGGAPCNFVQGQTAGVGTPLPPGYGGVKGESAYGTVSDYAPNPPRTYGVQLQFRF